MMNALNACDSIALERVQRVDVVRRADPQDPAAAGLDGSGDDGDAAAFATAEPAAAIVSATTMAAIVSRVGVRLAIFMFPP